MRRHEMVEALRSFFYDRRGDLKPFLMRDWTNYRLVDEPFGIGDDETTAFQITKTESAGSNPYYRVIRHIRAGTLVVKVDGVTQVVTTITRSIRQAWSRSPRRLSMMRCRQQHANSMSPSRSKAMCSKPRFPTSRPMSCRSMACNASRISREQG
jgi:ribosomal protein S12 methylthiotransferase accessory factor YcaO